MPAASSKPVRGRGRRWLAGIPVLLLATLGGWWVLSRVRTPEFGAHLKVKPLTGAAGLERHPAFSSDGTQIVYEWDRGDGHPHLYLKVVGPGDPVPLTFQTDVEFGPSWSPDGKWIAFLGQQRRSDSVGLFVVEPVGGTPRRVADITPLHFGVLRRPYRRLDWTRDSGHIIVSAPRPGFGDSLLLVSIDTRETAWLTASPVGSLSGDREPAVSPDGRSVAFARGSLDSEVLHVLRLTADLRPASDPSPISAAGLARSPAWLADSRQLIFASLKRQAMAGFALSWIDLGAGRSPCLLPQLGRDAGMPTVSRQGRLAWTTTTAEGHVWRQRIPGAGETAPSAVDVTSAAAIQLNARYSPDGARIAFASERSGAREIWNCDADAVHCVQVTFFNAPSTDTPRWSPDGKQLAFTSRAAGPEDIYVAEANGGAPRRLTAEGPHGAFPYWSRDSRWIYYSREGDRQIWKVPAAGGRAVSVSPKSGILIEESADSSHLYYIIDNNLYQSAADGSGEMKLVSGVAFMGATVDQGRIYYLREASPGIVEIWLHVLATGEDSRLFAVNKQLTSGLSLSPDGKSLLYSELRLRSNVMLAENLY